MILSNTNFFSKIKLISRDSKFFPKKLNILDDCPEVLFVIGDETILNDFSVSIVGTRNSSSDGNDIAFNLSRNLSKEGVLIVSGLASGIDTKAHMGTFADGKTVAIIACGFEHIFTGNNSKLIEEIINHGGAVVSEYFPDTPPQKFSFLRRNRLIAAISNATIVVEAPLNSGALNTARTAMKLRKPVFAVPWNINTFRGAGNNILLTNGGHVLTSYAQIVEFFHISSANKAKNNFLSFNSSLKDTKLASGYASSVPDEFLELYQFIAKNEPISKDEILNKFHNVNVAKLNATLTLMELQEFIILGRCKVLY